jgi:hypothetical protein
MLDLLKKRINKKVFYNKCLKMNIIKYGSRRQKESKTKELNHQLALLVLQEIKNINKTI